MKVVALLAALFLAVPLPASALGSPTGGATRVEAWQQMAPQAEYDRSTLSHLVKTGTDVYLDYGLVRAIAADYANGGDTISCAIYEMADAPAAFGLFSYFRSGKAALAIGDGGFGSDLLVGFWQDRYFVTVVETHQAGVPRKDSLIAFARSVSERIPKHAALPSMVERLPSGQTVGSETLLRGHVAARALADAWPSAELTFDGSEPLVTARYGGSTLWLVPFRDRGSLDAAWELAASKLRPEAGCDPADTATDDVVCVRGGSTAAARRVGGVLAIVSGAESLGRATALLDRVLP